MDRRTSHLQRKPGATSGNVRDGWAVVAARIVGGSGNGTHVCARALAEPDNPTGNAVVRCWAAAWRAGSWRLTGRSRSIVPIVVGEVVPLVPGLEERLRAGIDVLDIGCGKGRALIELAKAFPNSRFAGYDLSAEALAEAGALAHEARLNNIRCEERDLTVGSEPGCFDWITALTRSTGARPIRPWHSRGVASGRRFHAGDRRVEAAGGQHRTPAGRAVSCMHCMTVSLAQGGGAWGGGAQRAEAMLRRVLRLSRFTASRTTCRTAIL